MEMNKNEIIKICSEWVEKDEKRVAVVFLSEPVEDKDNKGNLASLINGDASQIASVLGDRISRSEEFTAVIRSAVAIAIHLRMKKMENEREDLKDKEE